LKDIYYSPETGYCGIQELRRKTKLPVKEITEFLHEQDEYTKHKPIKRKFQRRRVYVTHIDDQFQADLVDMQEFKKYNNDTNYILTVIDVFSKFACGIPIKNKTGHEIAKAFKLIFKERIPENIQTDKGTEFINKHTQKLFKDNNIHWFTTENIEIKASVVERLNRTLKTKMWKYFTANNTRRWIDVIDKLIYNYNNSYHRSIKMTPVEGSRIENQEQTNNRCVKMTKRSIASFHVGDKVRISKYKGPFKKGYLPNFTEEIFKISEVLKTTPVTYKIVDLNGEQILGTFYEPELVKYNKKDEMYNVEKIIKKKGDKYFVKWVGYPVSFNSWINKDDLKNI